LRETLSVSIDALRANKLRACLTALGVVIGSACIVLVVTVALTGRKFVLAQIESIGSNLIWVELVRALDRPEPLSNELTWSDPEAAQLITCVTVVGASRDWPMVVVVVGGVLQVIIVGCTMALT